ncbi:MAG: D-alanyl-D-alanine carboxypeptidase [Treponema sp.]|nr:D-alanyl-D-alanine carboxypeptidase [Treponema sp.]
MKKLPKIISISSAVLVCLLGMVIWFDAYLQKRAHPAPPPLTASEQLALSDARSLRYPRALLSPLPYQLSPPDFDLAAESVMVIDAANGSVVYEKNADAVIPPASLTKIAVMYVIFQEIAAGKLSLDDIVPLPPESWAINAPAGSSLMFLGPDQIVTLREVLLGLAVSSGNDAAVAAACYSAGSADAFCARMNAEMETLGLSHTRFADTSGYSEFNATTAREFAALARRYIEAYPEALAEYHSQLSFAYPKAHNYPNGRQQGSTIVQNSRNPALAVIDGSDGLKTGYIDESGYNLALTVQRDGTRFISVTLGGPGRNAFEGGALRLRDAQTITDWAFNSFYTRPADAAASRAVAVVGGRSNSLCAVSAYEEALTVPAIIPGETAKQTAGRVTVTAEIPRTVKAPVSAGEQIGRLVFQAEGITLAEIPLIADRSVLAGNPFKRFRDTLLSFLL